MDLLKKHYEKVLLGLVLVGLAGAVGFLYFKVDSEKTKLAEISSKKLNPKVKELPALDLSVPQKAMDQLAKGSSIDFSEPNKLFNPMPWQKTAPPDERLIPTTKVGPVAAVLTNIVPLHLRLTLDSINTSDSGAKYVIGVQKEAAATRAGQSKKQYYCTLDSKNEVFQLIEVVGPPDKPSKLVVRLNDSGDSGELKGDVPFERVDGYTATILYPPENKTFGNVRVGATLKFAGEEYNIVAINENEVVLSAKSNGKKWTIRTS